MAKYRWDVWLRRMISAAIGGAAGAMIGALAVVEETSSLPRLKTVGLVALIGAITHTLAYLKQEPLPPEDPTSGSH